MEQELPQENESQPTARNYRDRFIPLLVILIIFIVLIGTAQRSDVSDTEGPAISEAALEGDIAMKMAYASERWMSLSTDTQQAERGQSLQKTQRRTAITWYERAVRKDPSPANIRRLVIAQPPSKSPDAYIYLLEIRHKQLKSEAEMWRQIYVSNTKLSPKQVEEYTARIRSLKLGWHEHLALTALYNRAGRTTDAQKQHTEAIQSASRTMGWLVGLIITLVMFGLAGVMLIIWYITTGRMRQASISVESMPGDRGFTSTYLLEIFLVYVISWIVTQVTAVAIITLILPEGKADPLISIIATAGSYILGGVLAYVYLIWRLSRIGWTRERIGLSTQNAARDILWGIGGYAAALPLVVIAGLISQVVGRYIPTPPNPVVPLFMESETLFARLILFGLVAVAAPFFEELFFRGVLFGSFRTRWGINMGIIMSALVFASVHPLPLGLLPIFMLGSVFAILAYQRGSLLPAMVAHGLNNTVAFILLLILTE